MILTALISMENQALKEYQSDNEDDNSISTSIIRGYQNKNNKKAIYGEITRKSTITMKVSDVQETTFH